MKRSSKPWSDVLPDPMLRDLRWFYSDFLPELTLGIEHFQPDALGPLYVEWDCPEWTAHYDAHAEVGRQTVRAFTEVEVPSDASSDSDLVKWLGATISQIRTIDGDEQKSSIEGGRIVGELKPRLLPFLLFLYAQSRNMLAIGSRAVGAPVADLIARAREGDPDAMLKLVRVDPSFLSMSEIHRHVRIALVTGQPQFVEQLATALQKPLRPPKPEVVRDNLFLMLTWPLFYGESGLEQFSFFLGDMGMKRSLDVSTLRRKLNRLGLPTRE